MAKLFRFIFGYLLVFVRGTALERFLNLCGRRGIFPWKVRRNGDGMVLCLRLKDFYLLKPIVRKTKGKVVIQKRIGLPFFIPALKKRVPFLACAVVAILFWCITGSFLWNVTYEGNERVTKDQMDQFLEGRDIRLGSKISDINVSELEKEIRKSFPVITWTSITIKGSKMTISVKENEINEDNKSKRHGMNLISPCDGKVVKMVMRSGMAKVKVGDEVKRGQILIDSQVPIWNEDGTLRGWMESEADGDVYLERVRVIEDSIYFYYLENLETGQRKRSLTFRWNTKDFLPGRKPAYFYEMIKREEITPELLKKLATFLGMEFAVTEDLHIEYLPTIKKYEESDVRKLLEEKILRFLASLEEKGVQIIEKNVKIDIEGNFGLLYGEVLTIEKVQPSEETGEDIDAEHDGKE